VKPFSAFLLVPICALSFRAVHGADAPRTTLITAATVSAAKTVRAAAIPAARRLDLRPPRAPSIELQDSEEPQPLEIVAAPLSESRAPVQVSLVGIGSLYWAAQHPSQAWRVALPAALPGGVQ
jgi:hypothetical protein